MTRFVPRNIETLRAYLLALAFFGCLALVPRTVPARDQNFGDQNTSNQNTEGLFGTNLSFEQESDNGLPAGWFGDPSFFSFEKGSGRNGTSAFRLNADSQTSAQGSQILDVAPGTNLEYSVYVRAQDGEVGSVNVAIEWSAQGKYIGGSYSNRVIEEDGTDSLWKKIGGAAQVPLGVDRVTLLFYAMPGVTGTFWFDDCRVKEVCPAPFSGITSDHYRHITDGKDRGGLLTIRVGVALGRVVNSPREITEPLVITPDTAASNTTASNTAENNTAENNTAHGGAQAAELMKLSPCAYGEDYIDYTVPAGELPPGKYTASITVAVPRKSGFGLFHSTISLPFTRVDAYPERRAYIDRYHRLIVDGEPFFPLGCYFQEVRRSELETFADSPFNCIMPYAQISREELDWCQELNIKVLYSVINNFRTRVAESDEDGDERTRLTVEALRDHPAIIAWYINDELPLTMLPQLTARRDQMEELDPSRPTWVVLYQVNELREYIPTFDVIGTDLYPIPQYSASVAADAAKKTSRGSLGMHAMWQVPQIFDWASYKDNDEEKKANRPPTFEEIRGMFWMHIAGGANGLVAYSWFDLVLMDKTTEHGGHAYTREPFEERWSDVKRAAAEVANYIPVLLAVDPTIEARVSGDQAANDTVVRLYGHEGKTWMLIVNLLDIPQTVPFEAPEAESAEIQLGGKLAAFAEGKGTVELEPLQPCFVVLTPKK